MNGLCDSLTFVQVFSSGAVRMDRFESPPHPSSKKKQKYLMNTLTTLPETSSVDRAQIEGEKTQVQLPIELAKSISYILRQSMLMMDCVHRILSVKRNMLEHWEERLLAKFQKKRAHYLTLVSRHNLDRRSSLQRAILILWLCFGCGQTASDTDHSANSDIEAIDADMNDPEEEPAALVAPTPPELRDTEEYDIRLRHHVVNLDGIDRFSTMEISSDPTCDDLAQPDELTFGYACAKVRVDVQDDDIEVEADQYIFSSAHRLMGQITNTPHSEALRRSLSVSGSTISLTTFECEQ